MVITPRIFRYFSLLLPVLSLAVSACWNDGNSSAANNYPITAVVLDTGSQIQDPDDLSGEDPGSCSEDGMTGTVDCSIIYAASNGGGIFKSTDAGANWKQMVNGLTEWNVTALAIDPEVPDQLYAGTQNAGLFSSFTGGSAWTPIQLASITAITGIVVDPNTCQTPNSPCTDIYVSSEESGVWVSRDRGLSWTQLNQGFIGSAVTAIQIYSYSLNPSVLYAGTEEGRFYMYNRLTQKWEQLLPGLSEITSASPLVISVNPITPTDIYIGTSGGESESQGGTFQSIDGGHTWNKVTIPNAANFSVRVLTFCIQIEARCPVTVADSKSDQDQIDERTDNVLYGGVYGLSRSYFVDQPNDWFNIDLGGQIQAGNNVSAMGIDNIKHTTIYAGTLAGFIVKTTDTGDTWTRIDLEF